MLKKDIVHSLSEETSGFQEIQESAKECIEKGVLKKKAGWVYFQVNRSFEDSEVFEWMYFTQKVGKRNWKAEKQTILVPFSHSFSK